MGSTGSVTRKLLDPCQHARDLRRRPLALTSRRRDAALVQVTRNRPEARCAGRLPGPGRDQARSHCNTREPLQRPLRSRSFCAGSRDPRRNCPSRTSAFAESSQVDASAGDGARIGEPGPIARRANLAWPSWPRSQLLGVKRKTSARFETYRC